MAEGCRNGVLLKFNKDLAKSFHNDNELLQRMAKGDQQAFAILYGRYWEELFVTAARTLRGRDEAEDVLQDVFLSLWNRRQDLHIDGSLAAYLHTCMRYKAIQYIEKNLTRRDYLAFLMKEVSESLPANAENELQLKEVEQTIRETVARMPPKMQEVYKLSRQQRLSHKEIAERLNISVDTVRKHIQHALHLIRAELNYTSLLIFLLLFN